MPDELVAVLTVEDAQTIIWMDGHERELSRLEGKASTLVGVTEWEMLVEKARKVVAVNA